MEGQASICIRPSYLWPATLISERQLYTCVEEGVCIPAESKNQLLVGLFSGHGPAGSDVAVAACQILADTLAQQLQDEQYNLAPAALEAAFQQCHQQLLQLQPQQHSSISAETQGSSVNTATTSGASALLLALDKTQGKLLVASAGLCKAVLARCSATGELTVLELTPRLALGHDPTETARLDAAGSSIYYQQKSLVATTAATTNTVFSTSSTAGVDGSHDMNNSTGTSRTISSILAQHEAVLVTPDGTVLAEVGASRMLGFSAATSAGVLSEPVVTSWRLTGSESFVIIGSPGFWKALTPAEAVDYVAAALASGIPGSSSSTTAGGSSAAVTVGDLLTLEAQERLKLKVMDQVFSVCTGHVGASSTAAAGVVPDVTAAVVMLHDSPRMRSVEADQSRLAAELAGVSRACRSNAEAQALQALWQSSCFCCDRALAGPPAPAVSSLLPLLTVAGHCWPSTYWPVFDAAVTAPLAVSTACSNANAAGNNACGLEASESATGTNSNADGGCYSLLDAARAAGLLQTRSPSKGVTHNRHSVSSSSSAPHRRSSFALNSRLSCELDLSHDHGSAGSCGCLADCVNSSSTESPAEEQSMIVHKVRLSGLCELESLLFSNATTSHPDTTVARILKPCSSVGSWAMGSQVLSPSAAAASRKIAAGGVHMQTAAHQRYLPQRSASVSIAALAEHRSWQQQRYGSRSLERDYSRHGSLAAASSAICDLRSTESLVGHDPHKSNVLGHLLHEPDLLSNVAAVGQSNSVEQCVFGHAAYQSQDLGSGMVKKARSYQALSALQVANARSAASLPVHADLADSRLAAHGVSSTVRTSQSAAAAVLDQGTDATQTNPAFRSAFKLASDVGWESAAAKDTRAVPQPQQRNRPWTSTAAESAGTGTSSLARLQQQQQQHTLTLSFSCPAEGLDSVLGDVEGKVHGGILRGRCSSMKLADEVATSTAPAAGALHGGIGGEQQQQQAKNQGKVRGGQAANISSTSSSCSFDALHQQQQQQQQRPQCLEKSVRGGQAKGATFRKILTSPDLPSLAAASAAADAAYDDAAVAAVTTALVDSKGRRSSWDGATADAAKRVAAAAKHVAAPEGLKSLKLPNLRRRKQQQGSSSSSSSNKGSMYLRSSVDRDSSKCSSSSEATNSRNSSMDINCSSSSLAGVGAAAAASAVLSRSAASAGQADQQSTAFAAVANIGNAALPSAFSAAADISFSAGVADVATAGVRDADVALELSSAAGADGAVHGGELGDESLEGQMHGGKRSNSLTLSGSMLLPSLSFTSSASEDCNLTDSCLSPTSQQQPRSLFNKSSNSMSDLSSRSANMPPAAAVCQAGSGSGSSSSIQVIRTMSGSFTRVRLAASAPAAAGGDSSSSSLSAAAATDAPCEQQQQHYTTSCLQHYSEGPSHVRPAAAAVTRHAVSMGAEILPRAASGSSSSSRTVGGWNSSRAWGASSRKSSAIRFSKVPVTAAVGDSTATDSIAAVTNRTGASSSGAGMHFQSAFTDSNAVAGNAGGNSIGSSSMVQYSSSGRQVSPVLLQSHASPQSAFQAHQYAAAAAAAAAEAASAASLLQGMLGAVKPPTAHLASPKRQKSMPEPLPTLQESPVPTPSTSPAVAPGSTQDSDTISSSSYYACQDVPAGSGLTAQQVQEQANNLQQQLGLLAGQQQQQQQFSAHAASQGSSNQSTSTSPEHVSATGLVCSLEDYCIADEDFASDLNDPDLSEVLQQPGSPAVRPSRGSRGKSFEFSAPHGVVMDACYSSPAQMGGHGSLLHRR